MTPIGFKYVWLIWSRAFMLPWLMLYTLTQRADHPAFPMIVAAVAMAATLSMSVPFASLLVDVTGGLTATFPSWALRHGNFRVAALDAALSRSTISGVSKTSARAPMP